MGQQNNRIRWLDHTLDQYVSPLLIDSSVQMSDVTVTYAN